MKPFSTCFFNFYAVTKMRIIHSFWIILVVLGSPVQSDHLKNDDPSYTGHGPSHTHGEGVGDGHGIQQHHQHRGNGSLRLYHRNAEFAFRLYKCIASQPESQSKNVFFSPLSVSVALAALSLGARGKTHQQLFRGLGFNETELSAEEVNEAFLHILQDLNKKSDIDLSVGTAIFMNNTFKPKPEFLESMKKYYQAEGFTADFTKSDQTKDLINDYVKEKTQGKIGQLIQHLEPSTMMFLISYIYFQGKWEFPFDPSQTIEHPFYVDNQTTVQVQMMRQKKTVDIFHDQAIGANILLLHFKGSISTMLVLPEHGLDRLKDNLCMDHVIKWHRWKKQRTFEVFIPKFSIKTTYSLQTILAELGISNMFSDNADFTGVGISQEYQHKFSVSKIIHQATLDVDEFGVSASGATAVLLRPMSYAASLKFDRPFMVIISNHDTKSILFMGKIVNPADS